MSLSPHNLGMTTARAAGRSLRGSASGVVALAAVLVLSLVWRASAEASDDSPAVLIGNMEYAGAKTGQCFADGFLATAAREMQANIDPRFYLAKLGSDEIFDYPFIVMSGEGSFRLSEREMTNLRDYLDRGGFLLASAGCSNADWARSFEAVMRTLYPDQAMVELEPGHPLFHTVYDIERIEVKKTTGGPAALYALMRGERVAMVYSPLGLNDTANAGAGCCCCGGNEIRNAKLINVNILAYALTH